jgi:Ni/Co efflux regulator RcnB
MQGMKKLLAAAIAIAMLAAPTQAMAQAPTNDSYDDSSVQTVDPADPADPVDSADPASEDGTGGSLPFTGTDVALLVAAGGGLLVLGFGVRRLTRRPDTA